MAFSASVSIAFELLTESIQEAIRAGASAAITKASTRVGPREKRRRGSMDDERKGWGAAVIRG